MMYVYPFFFLLSDVCVSYLKASDGTCKMSVAIEVHGKLQDGCMVSTKSEKK